MAFLEERISVNIQHGFSYEDDFNVQITRTASGQEYRHLVHPIPLRVFTIHYIADRPTIWTDIYNLYHRAYGKYAGFRAKVLDDFTTNSNVLAPTHLDQNMVQLTTTTFQIVKQYGSGGTPLGIGLPKRTIYKPVAGTLKVGISGVNTLFNDVTHPWSVNLNTGIVTFTTPPLVIPTCGCEFDLPVRFNSNVSLRQDNGWRDTSDIQLIELLNPGV